MMEDHEAFPVDNLPKADVDRPVLGQMQNSYFLNKFLYKKTAENTAEETKVSEQPSDDGEGISKEVLEDRVIGALKEIYDPEIPVNIYELGLIYDVEVDDNLNVLVTMTLTTPHCPVAESMPGEVELRVNSVKGTKSAEVRLVWDPPWDMARMSDEARLELGLL
ncbi:SUF system Fe-S cluster assembly protein [Kordiimonas sp. SCSIO 12610]|uniref:SUF system Fe-S cluster assembly protein n=1 Tax=Kordiimonas sp. SCSIO 12610 TaxID=2829597 RepID=UPI00351DE731